MDEVKLMLIGLLGLNLILMIVNICLGVEARQFFSKSISVLEYVVWRKGQDKPEEYKHEGTE